MQKMSSWHKQSDEYTKQTKISKFKGYVSVENDNRACYQDNQKDHSIGGLFLSQPDIAELERFHYILIPGIGSNLKHELVRIYLKHRNTFVVYTVGFE